METQQMVFLRQYWFPMGILALILIMGLSGCIGQTGATEEFRETYEVDAGTVLEVYNINGEISVTKWDRAHVEVYALIKAINDSSDLDKVSINVGTGDLMIVETSYTAQPDDIEVVVEYSIKVPADIIVGLLSNTNGRLSLEGTTGDTSLATTNGDVSVTNVDGSVLVTASNGNIEITDVTGVRGAKTTNGEVTVELPSLTKDVEIGSTNGKVKVYVPEDLDADVMMETTNGKVTVHDIQMTTITKSPSENKVVGTMGNGVYDLTITTTNGDIDLYQMST